MALYRYPAAARGNPHRLMVVTDRPATGKGIAQPEATLESDGIGNVGESGRALVRRDNEIGVITVADHDAVGMHDLVFDQIVGDRQKAADEDAIAFGALCQPSIAIGSRIGQALRIKTALRTRRHNHRIFHPLGLHQAKDFGAEIIAPVRPAQPTSGNRPGPQMDTFDTRRIDENLTPGQRRRQARHLRAVQLERQRLMRCGRKGVGPQTGLHHRLHQPKDAILVSCSNFGQALLDLIIDPGTGGDTVSGKGRIVQGFEQRNDRPHDAGMHAQRSHHCGDAIGYPRLAQIAVPGTQPDHRTRFKPGKRDQLVERIIFRLAVEYLRQRCLDHSLAIKQRVRVRAAAKAKMEIMDIGNVAITNLGRHLLDHGEAEIFQHRHRIRQWHRPALIIDFQAECIVVAVIIGNQPRDPAMVALHRQQAQHILRSLCHGIGHAMRLRECRGITLHHRGGALFIGKPRQFAFHRRFPAAHHQLHTPVKRGLVYGDIAILEIEKVAQQTHAAIFKPDRPAKHGRAAGLCQHRLDRTAQPC